MYNGPIPVETSGKHTSRIPLMPVPGIAPSCGRKGTSEGMRLPNVARDDRPVLPPHLLFQLRVCFSCSVAFGGGGDSSRGGQVQRKRLCSGPNWDFCQSFGFCSMEAQE